MYSLILCGLSIFIMRKTTVILTIINLFEYTIKAEPNKQKADILSLFYSSVFLQGDK